MRLVLTILLLVAALPVRGATLLDESATADPAVADAVHDVAVAALLGRVGALDDGVVTIKRIDDGRREAGRARTGLADDFELLAAALRPTRDARRDAFDEVLDDDPDPVVEKLAKYALEHEDDAGAADQLLSDDRHNRRATVLNDALRPLGVFSGAAFLAAANPFLIAGSALDSLITTAVNLYHYDDLSPREREALVRYRRQLTRDPNTTAAPDIVDAAHEINKRRSAALCKETADLASKALDDDDLDRARFYAGSADRLEGCDRADKIREPLAKALAARDAKAEAARWPADDLRLPPADEAEDYRALVVTTARGDGPAMMSAAQTFTSRHPDSHHDDAATLTVAVARDLAGHRAAASEALHEIAGNKTGPGRIATAMLESPRFHGLDGMDDAELRHARDVAQYVLIGGGVSGKDVLYTASQVGAQGLQAAESFGIFNVIGVITRAWTAWRKDPASNQAIIDEGERFLVREPDSPEVSDVHERLATAYERAGKYDRALFHYRATARPDPERIGKLEEKIAEQLWENAQKSDGEPALLAAIVEYYPTTDTAEKARKALKEYPRSGEVKLSREVLLGHPSLLGPTALDLSPVLLDGKLDNGELADAGVTVSPSTLVLTLRDPKGGDDMTERRPLSPEAYARARAAGEGALYASTLTTDPKAKEVGSLERYIPFFIAGEVGEEGSVSIAPGLKLRPESSDDRPLYQ
jgi:tetratricopeptide (TPR) repeat protein